jgi:uncharacterized damage-inducible protein DinB
MATDPWLAFAVQQFRTQRETILKAASQLTDDEFARRPATGFNSVATIVRHLAGNLRSRFTDFLTTDGEKPDRDRESEFLDWPGTRAELMSRFESSFELLLSTLSSLSDADLDRAVTIRTQAVPVRQAIVRALDHIAGHVGQIQYIARLVHSGEWNWISIAPGRSNAFNQTMSRSKA